MGVVLRGRNASWRIGHVILSQWGLGKFATDRVLLISKDHRVKFAVLYGSE